jgi:hypothetical protein
MATTPDAGHLVAALVYFIDPPPGLVHSAIIRHDCALVLAACVNPGEKQSSEVLLGMVRSSPSCRDGLARALVHLFIAVGYVEGARRVFDKDSARASLLDLIRHLWLWPSFREAL